MFILSLCVIDIQLLLDNLNKRVRLSLAFISSRMIQCTKQIKKQIDSNTSTRRFTSNCFVQILDQYLYFSPFIFSTLSNALN